jgi:hypothetical protein
MLLENCAKLFPVCAGLSEAQPILESTEVIGRDGGTNDSTECLCVRTGISALCSATMTGRDPGGQETFGRCDIGLSG